MHDERMRRFWRLGYQWMLSTFVFVFAKTIAQELAVPVPGKSFEATKACHDFADSSLVGLPWTLDDCLNVWEDYRNTLEVRYHVRPPHVDSWRATADNLRRAGSPCLLTSMPSSDGVGSATMRHFSNWILARELGCDWITPHWGTKALKMYEYNKTSDVVYCHSHASLADRGNFTLDDYINSRRCTVVNWLQYFNFDLPSTDVPQGAILETIEAPNALIIHLKRMVYDETGSAISSHVTLYKNISLVISGPEVSALCVGKLAVDSGSLRPRNDYGNALGEGYVTGGVCSTPCLVVDHPLQMDYEGVGSLAEDVAINEASVLSDVKTKIETKGMANLPWDRLVITMARSLASAHLAATGSWDQRKNKIVRETLQEARSNFHQHPRPWYDEDLQCAFDPTRLNFGVHVRLGDRSASTESLAQHFLLLEELMGTITNVMEESGLEPPLFHVFSETKEPCPSLVTGLFNEFPTWPVEIDQVPPCLMAKAPVDCPLKSVQRGCFPERSGIFRLQDKPIVLHVSTDVTNALSCMIHSDGVVMGCSTFGQIAGLLTKGISFFSIGCKGDMTPVQYKTIPPIAVAERGHLWVPLSGSWHDPTLKSTHTLRRALDIMMANRESG